MNTYDERMQIPPPHGCLACAKCENTVTAGVARHRCGAGHPMHELCGFFVPTVQIAHEQTEDQR
jgi:hypothetical protein